MTETHMLYIGLALLLVILGVVGTVLYCVLRAVNSVGKAIIKGYVR